MVALLWVLSLLALTGIVFAHFSFNADQYTVLEGALFNSLSRVSWSGALCVVILLCVNGYGGVVNSFLSSNVFTAPYDVIDLTCDMCQMSESVREMTIVWCGIQIYHIILVNY
jgi:hypothetical protein